MNKTITHHEILLVGATGTVGSLVLKELLTRHVPVRVLVRRQRPVEHFPPSVTQVVADLSDEQAVRAALQGIDAALYISPHDVAEQTLADNFVQAAEANGTRIVFAGVHLPGRTLTERLQRAITAALFPTYRHKFGIGRRIAASRTKPVMFIPTNFFQNDEIFDADIRTGLYPLPMRRVNRVDVRDLAELCADALLNPHYPPGEHMVAGPVSLSGEESAHTWAAALDRPVAYVGDDPAIWQPIFRRRLSGQKLNDLLNTSTFLGRRSIVVPKWTEATTQLLGRPPRSYAAYVGDQISEQTTADQTTADQIRLAATTSETSS